MKDLAHPSEPTSIIMEGSVVRGYCVLKETATPGQYFRAHRPGEGFVHPLGPVYEIGKKVSHSGQVFGISLEKYVMGDKILDHCVVGVVEVDDPYDQAWHYEGNHSFFVTRGLTLIGLYSGTHRTHSGYQFWFAEGRLHNDDGPAIVLHGTDHQEWYVHGARHREDGPAIVRKDGSVEYYTEGVLHRDDGPAIIAQGGQELHWYRHGKRHREDGPAVVLPRGIEQWYLNGIFHRPDGPADNRGYLTWAHNGQIYRTQCRLGGKIVTYHYKNKTLHRDDGPAIEFNDGTQYWFANGHRHRLSGPAVIKSNGDQKWYRQGRLHREDGPAIIISRSGDQYWYQDGRPYRPGGLPTCVRGPHGNRTQN